ncbi:hypothetical protein JCM19039_3907 [Geomicrobium sp. JCM 19039]|nr:hypothetical protein JCM19039_3907 [Geomicrobium sp. JCM 19039]
MQVSAYMQEDQADYLVDEASLLAGEVLLWINLASGHTDDEVQRTITGLIGWPGLNEADWNALEDKEAPMDWGYLKMQLRSMLAWMALIGMQVRSSLWIVRKFNNDS